MKRLFPILLVGILLMGMVGCHGSTPKLEDPSFATPAMTPGSTTTSYDGIEIQIDSLHWHECNRKTTLVVVWNNKTQYEVTYGAAFAIERLDGGEWVSCAIPEDPVFDLLAYPLPAGKMKNETYILTDMFDVSSPGIYRFKTDCYVACSDKHIKCQLTAEFTVGNVKCPDDSKETGTEADWCAQYIRTNGSSSAVLYPSVRIINSLQELKDYYSTWNEVFDLERKERVYSDTTIGFLDACDPYDDTFFEKNYLIFVLLEEGSGSIHHEVRSVTQTDDKKIAISIDRKVPEVGTADMAQWHIILELSRDVPVGMPDDILVYLDGSLFWDGSPQYPVMPIAAIKEPPKGALITPEGEIALITGGYSWIYEKGDGTAAAAIADQVSRPLPQDSLKPVTVNNKYAETVYAPVPGSDTYAPTNSLGCLLKLNWEADPTSVTYTCWPEAVWQKGNTPEETVVFQKDFAFYAKPGGYIYEIAAAWDDTGVGYHGTANYYVYIIGGNEVSQ